VNDHSEVDSFDGVADLLTYAAHHPDIRDLPVRVHGFYMAFRPGRGPARFGVLLSRPEQIEDVERAYRIPAKIDFGVNVAIRIRGVVDVCEPLTPP
jgi:hypothetical protein